MFDIFGTKDPQKALEKAREYIRENKITSAIKVLEDNLTDSEESFDLYLEVARLYFETEQRGRAAEIFRHTKSILPSKTDEIIALTSSLFYSHASIDIGDFLLQSYVEKEEYEQEQIKIDREALMEEIEQALIKKMDRADTLLSLM